MEETTKYRQEWEEYKDKKAVGFVFILIGIPIFAGIIYFSRNYPQFSKYIQIILPIVIGILFFAGLYFRFYGNRWKCPRCREDFRLQKGFGAMTGRNCLNCNLPLYYGSPYFYDEWGTEKGKELAKMIAENKL